MAMSSYGLVILIQRQKFPMPFVEFCDTHRAGWTERTQRN